MELHQTKDHVLSPAGGLGLRYLSLAAVVATFALITLGGVVRVTDSGLACPDWPLCHGRLIPPLESHVLIEYSHRLLASLVGILVVLMGVVTWWKYRSESRIVIPVTLALGFLVAEVILGGITVVTELPPAVVTAHLAVSQALLALLLIVLVQTWRLSEAIKPFTGSLFWWTLVAALGTLVVLLSGSYAVGAGAGTACTDWPLCNGSLLPSGELEWTHMTHRLLAGMIAVMVGWVAVLAWRHHPRSPLLPWLSALIVFVLVAQVLAGAANPWFDFVAAARALHLSLATVLWGGLVMLVALAWPPPKTLLPLAIPPNEAQLQQSRSLGRVISSYISLTKPHIMLLLLLTALGGMVLAAKGMPSLGVLLAVLTGGAMASGGASAINHALDQDIDQRMKRTRRRPVAAWQISPRAALAFGLALNFIAFATLWVGANLTAALLAMSGTALYVLVYTRWLKRSTTQNIVIGGAAGAIPPLVGWAAVTGSLDLPAFYLFAIIFFWTPPHFWALSLLMKDDYARANIPMLPVIRGVSATARDILLYTILLVTITILFFTLEAVGWLYFAGAIALGTVFLVMAWRLLRSSIVRRARQLYLYSLLYLALLFGVVIVDSAVQL